MSGTRRLKHFVLKNIDPGVIDDKYNFSIDFNLDRKNPPANCTRIDQGFDYQPSVADPEPPIVPPAPTNRKKASNVDTPSIKVIHDGLTKIPVSLSIPGDHLQDSWRPKDTVTLTYLDECKKEHECVSTMISASQKSESLSEQSLLHCFWCRHPFPHRPIGVPISYVPNRVHKQYYSEITQDTYILRENVDKLKPVLEGKQPTSSVLPQFRDYYVSDGVFCSFNCAMAFIKDCRHDPVYQQSETLLNKIYHEVYGSDTTPIEPSPSWRLLRNYGGHLTIEDFRRNLFKIDYRPMENVLMPTFRPIGFLFEKQVRI